MSRTWGTITADAKRLGRRLPANDSWLAACCLANDLPLATRTTKDFADLAEHTGLVLLQLLSLRPLVVISS